MYIKDKLSSNVNIPKIIHYIWLGNNKKPKSFDIAINSWQTFAKDWNIIRWSEDNIGEFVLPEIFYKFLKAKKYAFASDVLRFYILQKYGGFYMDIDQILIKDINLLLRYIYQIIQRL